jgi:hypothetical protein
MTTERNRITSSSDERAQRARLLALAARELLPARLLEPARRARQRIRRFIFFRPEEDRALLFHAPFYLETNPHLGAWRVSPYFHFVRRGWREGRSPHPIFDVPFYLRHAPQVAASKVNPVRHFLMRGWAEGRNPNRLFDCEFYLQTYRDVAAAGINPLLHYLRNGAREGRDPGPLFDTKCYQQLYPTQVLGGLDPLSHYLWRGLADGHRLSPSRHVNVPLLGRQFRRVRGGAARVPSAHLAGSDVTESRNGFHA